MKEAHPNDPSLESWIQVPKNSDFPIQNLPFGVFRKEGSTPGLASAIGDKVVDLTALYDLGYFDDLAIDRDVIKNRYINDLMELGKPVSRALRRRLSEILRSDSDLDARQRSDHFLYDRADVQLLLPIYVRDYTDFYSSEEHATNIGTMFRGKDNALMPNWKHLPVGYHGRASSIVVSGTDIHRPKGQLKPDEDKPPIFDACNLLDFELEMAFVVGKSTRLGHRISTDEAENYIFGMVLFNDWSARDIQKWEYVPLGPFLAKSFASTISPWVVTLDALEPFRVESRDQDPPVLSYLDFEGKKSFDIQLEVDIKPEDGEAKTVCRSNFKHMYWNMSQQLAHHTVNGCNFNVGDMCASGTISGKSDNSYGSMLELTWRGEHPIAMPDGSERKFIEDGDTVRLKGYAEKDGVRIGFGEASGKILPAID